MGMDITVPPEIHQVPKKELYVVAGLQETPNRNLLGAYIYNFDTKVGTIYLPDSFNPKNQDDQSTLVHELMHHYQYTSGVQYYCVEHFEAHAYYIEQVWRGSKGLPWNIDPIRITHMLMCDST